MLAGGLLPALTYVRQYQTWGPVPSAPAADALDIQATNLAAVTVDPGRAHVDCRARVSVRSDGPIRVTLAGCGQTISAG